MKRYAFIKFIKFKNVYSSSLLSEKKFDNDNIPQDNSNPLWLLIAYKSFSLSCWTDSYCGNFNKFMQVAADGRRAAAAPEFDLKYILIKKRNIITK